MVSELWRVIQQCEANGDYGPLATHVRRNMRRLKDANHLRAMKDGDELADCGLVLSKAASERLAGQDEEIEELVANGRYEDAVRVAEEAIDNARAEFGDDNELYASQLKKLGVAYLRAHKTDEAKAVLAEALFLLEEIALGDANEWLANWYLNRRRRLEGMETAEDLGRILHEWGQPNDSGEHNGNTNDKSDTSTATSAEAKHARSVWRKCLVIGGAIAAAVVFVVFLNWPKRIEVVDRDRVVVLRGRDSLSGFDDQPKKEQDAVANLLWTKEFDTPPVLRQVRGAGPAIKGETPHESTGVLLTPVGTAEISDSPLFTWNRVPGAKRYRVIVYDSDHKRVVTKSSWLSDSSWMIDTSLARENIYSWRLYWETRDGKEFVAPPPEGLRAKFKVLSLEDVQRIVEGVDELGDSHLLALLFYVDNGLLDQAEAELSALLEDNPNSKALSMISENFQKLRGRE